MKNEWIGTVEFIGVARTAGTFVSSRVSEATVDFGGFPGDRHYGATMPAGGRQPFYPRGTEIRNNRQFSLLAAEELADMAAALDLPSLQPELWGANLVLGGIPNLTRLPALTRLFFPGNAVLVVEGENHPCSTLGNEIQNAFPAVQDLAVHLVEKARHRRGVVGWVECPGLIRMGDEVRVVVPG